MPKFSHPLLIDSLGATILVFFLCWLLKLIVFDSEFMNPIHSIVHHVQEECSNLVYDNTRAREGISAATICLVDIGKANRSEIAGILKAIARQKPRLVAVDIVFDKKNMAIDTNLQLALKQLQQQQKLVMASWVKIKGKKGAENIELHKSDSLYQVGPTGYTNFVAEEINGVVRHHLSQLESESTQEPILSFAAQVVSMSAPKTWQAYGRHHEAKGYYEPDWILYQKDQSVFSRLKASDLTGNAHQSDITGKIVLVGSTEETDDHNEDFPEDLHLVPLEDDDVQVRMTGLQIHANIMAMLLDGTHLRKVPNWVVWLMAFLLCWLLMVFLLWKSQQGHHGIGSHFFLKFVELATVVSIIVTALLLFQFRHVELSTLPLLVPIALASDGLLFYESFIRWLSSKIRLPYKSYFKNADTHTKKPVSSDCTHVPGAPVHPRR